MLGIVKLFVFLIAFSENGSIISIFFGMALSIIFFKCLKHSGKFSMN